MVLTMLRLLRLSLFRGIYEIALQQRVEVAGTVYLADEMSAESGKKTWRLGSIVFGDAHTVEGPIPGPNELSYHVHIPHGGQICMPPSPQDWLVLIRNQLPVAYVIAREGVYKFWWEENTKHTIMNKCTEDAATGGVSLDEWIREIESLEEKLIQVHKGVLSITDYKKLVSLHGMCMEFRSL